MSITKRPPKHRDWVIYRAYTGLMDPFVKREFYFEFQVEIEVCRQYMNGPAMDSVIQDIQIDLENRKAQVLLERNR